MCILRIDFRTNSRWVNFLSNLNFLLYLICETKNRIHCRYFIMWIQRILFVTLVERCTQRKAYHASQYAERIYYREHFCAYQCSSEDASHVFEYSRRRTNSGLKLPYKMRIAWNIQGLILIFPHELFISAEMSHLQSSLSHCWYPMCTSEHSL